MKKILPQRFKNRTKSHFQQTPPVDIGEKQLEVSVAMIPISNPEMYELQLESNLYPEYQDVIEMQPLSAFAITPHERSNSFSSRSSTGFISTNIPNTSYGDYDVPLETESNIGEKQFEVSGALIPISNPEMYELQLESNLYPEYQDVIEMQPVSAFATTPHERSNSFSNRSSTGNISTNIPNTSYGDYDVPLETESNVHTCSSLIVIVVHILIGAVIFCYTEGYDFVQSVYFVFITTSTIGYGDIIPDGVLSMSLLILYLTFALSFLSTMVTLWQRKMIKQLEYPNLSEINLLNNNSEAMF